MAYYSRVFAKATECPSVEVLQAALEANGRTAVLSLEEGAASAWTRLVLRHPKGLEIAEIERSVVSDSTLGHDEVTEFIEDIQGCRPDSGAEWVRSYLARVRNVYAFQHLPGADRWRGIESLRIVAEAIRDFGGGIIQSDGEGFSNEQGYHVLWQFSDRVSGFWWMAVLQDGRWIGFRMELGDNQHRQAFFEGRVPEGVETA
jgi:hypothetical protein